MPIYDRFHQHQVLAIAGWKAETLDRAYFQFVQKHSGFLTFGVLLTATAGFGNSFFIGLFGEHLRHAFAISHGEFGLLFMGASVVCGLSLPLVGKYIDHVALSVYAASACLVLTAGAILLAVSANAAVLLVALFMIRLGGPGMLSHAAVTSMGYYFTRHRGRAVGITLLGQPISEAGLPAFAVASITVIGWRETWIIAAGAIILVCLPAAIWLLRNHERDGPGRSPLNADKSDPISPKSWTRRQVLGDWRFYAITLALIWSTATISGLFFHQAHIAAAKGWSLAWVASCFVGFAAAKVVAIMTAGPLIDRFGSTKALPVFLLPLAFGVTSLAAFEAPIVAMAYFAGAGLSAGAGFTLHGTIWAELYGTNNLGAVRSLARSITFPASAIAPAVVGMLFDYGVAVPTIAFALAGCIFATCVVVATVEFRH
jgi:MFS family permease